MNNIDDSGYKYQDCKSTSHINGGIYTFLMECSYLENGERYWFKYDNSVDITNNKVIKTNYSIR